MGEWNLVESRKRKETRVQLALDCGAWMDRVHGPGVCVNANCGLKPAATRLHRIRGESQLGSKPVG